MPATCFSESKFLERTHDPEEGHTKVTLHVKTRAGYNHSPKVQGITQYGYTRAGYNPNPKPNLHYKVEVGFRVGVWIGDEPPLHKGGPFAQRVQLSSDTVVYNFATIKLTYRFIMKKPVAF